MKLITVNVTEKHNKKKFKYLDTKRCLLALALGDVFPLLGTVGSNFFFH